MKGVRTLIWAAQGPWSLPAWSLAALPVVHWALSEGGVLALGSWRYAAVLQHAALLWAAALGGVLGAALQHLIGAESSRLVPRLHGRVSLVATLLGALLWGLITMAFHLTEGDLPWQRWMPLFVYGSLGLGFELGLWTPRTRSTALQRGSYTLVLGGLIPALMFSLTPGLAFIAGQDEVPLSLALSSQLPGVTPVTVLCLLLGPLTWHTQVALRAWAVRSRPVVVVSTPRTLMQGRGAWGFAAALHHSAPGDRAHLRFLLLPVAALGAKRILVFIPLWYLAFAVGTDGPPFGESLRPVLPVFAIVFLSLVGQWSTTSARAGRLLLLPGGPSRARLAREVLWQWGRATLPTVLIGVALLCGSAYTSGHDGQELLLQALRAIAIFLLALALGFWRAPRVPGDKAMDAPVLAATFVLSMFLLHTFPDPREPADLLAALLGRMTDIALPRLPWTVGLILSLLFVAALTLRAGLNRWARADLGA